MSDGGAADKWRHLREVLAERTPGEPVDCEDCGETISAAQAVPSPYEADDGGSYCPACAAREWAGDIEQREALKGDLARERARAATLRAALDLLRPVVHPEQWHLLAVHRGADGIVCGAFRWPHETTARSIARVVREWPWVAVASWIWVDEDAERAYRAALAADAPGDAGEGTGECHE